MRALCDSGADISLIRASRARALGLKPRVTDSRVGTANGQDLVVQGEVEVDFQLGPIYGRFKFRTAEYLSPEVILGYDFLAKFNLSPNPGAGHLEMGNHTPLSFLPIETRPRICSIDTPEREPDFQLGDKLTTSQRAVLCKMLKGAPFATEQKPFGRAVAYTHTIDVQSANPIHQGLRRTSPREREIISQHVHEMLAMGVIRPSTSPWASAVVLAKKKDGADRFCVDYRRLNEVTVKDVYPLPRIDDMLAALAGKKYFTSLDAASGYWQIPMEASSIPLTAFICHEGLFEFEVMPFGLTNAPATFQRMMNAVLGDLLWHKCFVYLDDILVFGSTFEEHLGNLRTVFDRMRQAGLLLKKKKCHFALSSLTFLGFVVSDHGIKTDPDKVAKLREFPQPRNTTEVRAFVGLGSYYRRFIKDFAIIASPLHELSTTEAWEWKPEHQKAFETLKKALLENATLAHPDFSKPFILDTDASDMGMAAVVSQVDEQGKERIVVMDSRKFSPAERKWHIREKEALGIIWGLERFKSILQGSQFVIRTDHSSLKWLQEAKSGRLQRWAIRLAEFGPLDIQHRSGVSHGNVDAFTRTFAMSELMPDDMFACPIFVQKSLFPTEDEWRAAQKTCRTCNRLKDTDMAVYREGILGLGRRNRWRPVLPESLAVETAKKWHIHHLGGHLSARKLLSLMSRKMILPRGIVAVQEVIRACKTCLQRKPPKTRLGQMASRPPLYPWHTVAMDFCGPYTPATGGSRYVLVFVDHFTKWVELCPTEDQLATTVMALFYDRVVCRHGVPQRLLSDNGPQFKSALVETMCSYFGIEKIYSSAYYPQGDGYAERMMRTLNNSLSVLSAQDPLKWDTFVAGLQFAYNCTEHEATGVSPFEANTGRIPRLPGEKHFRNEVEGKTANDYTKKLRNVVTACHERAKRSVEAYWNSMKRRFDKHRKDVTLKPGSWVLSQLTDAERRKYPVPKLAPRWSRPAEIVRALTNGVTYVVKLANGEERTRHISNLLPIPETAWGEEYPTETPKAPVEEPAKKRVVEVEEDSDEEIELIFERPVGRARRASATTPRVVTPPPTRDSTQDDGEVIPIEPITPTPGRTPVELRLRTPVEDWTHVPPPPQGTSPSATARSDDADRLWAVDRLLARRWNPGTRRVELLVRWATNEETWQPRVELMKDIPKVVRRFERDWRRRGGD